MKNILAIFLFASIFTMPLHAIETESHDNRLYITIDKCENITQVPISLHLENPTIDITAIEMYLTLPIDVRISSIEPTSRCATNHKITTGDTPNGYFVSIASDEIEKFDYVEGAICTLLCDFSALADGDYTISTSGVFAVGVADEEITCYTTTNQEEQYTKKGNAISSIESIIPNMSNGCLEIYNIQGIRLDKPQKGQIHIVNGKKVIQ